MASRTLVLTLSTRSLPTSILARLRPGLAACSPPNSIPVRFQPGLAAGSSIINSQHSSSQCVHTTSVQCPAWLAGSRRLCCVEHCTGSGITAGSSLRGGQPWSWCVVRHYAKKGKKDKGGKGGKKKVGLSAEDLEGVLDMSRLQDDMYKVVEELKQQMIQQISLRTNIGAYDKLPVQTEDGVFPLMQLGQVVQKNPSLILVNMAAAPQYVKAAVDAIGQSGLNVSPQQEGTTIFIPVPKVTREFREGLAKNAKVIHDKAKVRLRDIHNKHVKKVRAVKDQHSEDIIRGAQDVVLDEMHKYVEQLDSLLAAKQQELLGGK